MYTAFPPCTSAEQRTTRLLLPKVKQYAESNHLVNYTDHTTGQ